MAEDMLDGTTVGSAKGNPGGYAAVFPLGTTLDTLSDVTKTLTQLVSTVTDGASLGYISEDGVTMTTDTDSEDIKDWAGDVVKSSLSSFSLSFQATFMESRDSVLKTVFGDDNVTEDSSARITKINQNFTDGHAFVFEHVLGDGLVRRTVILNGSIVERDDLTMNSSDVLGYTPTIKALPYNGSDPAVFIDFDPTSTSTTTTSTSTKSTTTTSTTTTKD